MGNHEWGDNEGNCLHYISPFVSSIFSSECALILMKSSKSGPKIKSYHCLQISSDQTQLVIVPQVITTNLRSCRYCQVPALKSSQPTYAAIETV